MEKMPYHPELDTQVFQEPSGHIISTDWQHGLPVLSGTMVTLRELRTSDASSLFAMLTPEEVSRFISPPPSTVEGFERFIAWTLRQRTAGVYACFAVMAVIYLFCGLSKLRDSGLDWFQGENIQHKLLQDTLEPIFLDHHWKATIWLVQHDTPQFVYSLIGIVGVAAELGYFTVLFSRTARIVMPVVAFGVHLGILVLQHILFLDLLILQLVFLNADRLGAFALRRFRFRGKGEGSPRAAHHGKERRPVPLVAFASMAIMIAGLFVIWVFRIEYYPVSSWHMYSKRESNTPIFYYKMVATLEDGRSITLPRRDYCPAVMPNSRTILHKAFNKSSQSGSFDQFLSDYVERRNRKLAFGSPISSIEVQRWKWNYAVDPHDPRFGWITHRYLYNAVTKQAGRAALLDNDWTNSQTSLGRISMANLQY